MRTRLSKLMRENGWVAVGIYTALSLLDFTACFLLVNAVGADVVKKGEQWIWTRLGFQVVELSPDEEAASGKEKTTVWTRLALAYGIHKTLLLPFRVGVTAWVTPASVR